MEVVCLSIFCLYRLSHMIYNNHNSRDRSSYSGISLSFFFHLLHLIFLSSSYFTILSYYLFCSYFLFLFPFRCLRMLSYIWITMTIAPSIRTTSRRKAHNVRIEHFSIIFIYVLMFVYLSYITTYVFEYIHITAFLYEKNTNFYKIDISDVNYYLI